MPSAQFLKNFIRNPLRNASVVPSSRQAARKMISDVDFSSVQYIVELGPGTGVFTQAICESASPGAEILAIDLESTYVQALEMRFQGRVDVVHGSADALPELIEQRGWPRVDLIVSGLPFVLPREVKLRLFSFLESVTAEGTTLRWFTYMPALMKPHYRTLNLKKHAFVAWNLPPMWIYTVN